MKEKNVLNKMYASEVKVDLSLVDDFKSALNGLIREPKNENKRKVRELVKEIERRINDAQVILTRVPKVQQTGMQLEKAFKDLGVPLTADYELMKDNLFKEEKNLKEQISEWTAGISKLMS